MTIGAFPHRLAEWLRDTGHVRYDQAPELATLLIRQFWLYARDDVPPPSRDIPGRDPLAIELSKHARLRKVSRYWAHCQCGDWYGLRTTYPDHLAGVVRDYLTQGEQ